MAIVAEKREEATVVAQGEALNATVNFSGALMEMLATVYTYILMAAIREGIQNACDAARRAGLSFSDGVEVLLPTAVNPVFTVIDRGAGMTREFMESTYLSFGSSTKSADNDSAGGLGVGRWAAYGYIRECYITTTSVDEMIERTYFQFQGPNGTPQVQLASEKPGTVAGTRVSFPVKESDIPEALRAVAWLKGVMQLTMGDSFSVDEPSRLPRDIANLPYSGEVLDLGMYDSTLEGGRIYPMQTPALKYSRQSLTQGSLLVMTNQEKGVGGLPFHVDTTVGLESVFAFGMIVEVPMALRIPFMPSRETIKYTDEVEALLKRIDEVARTAVVQRVEMLYRSPAFRDKGRLSNLLGNEEGWHCFAQAARATSYTAHEALAAVCGGQAWRGRISIDAPDCVIRGSVKVRYHQVGQQGTREVFASGVPRKLSISLGRSSVSRGVIAQSVTFNPNALIELVVNDLKVNGLARFRDWVTTQAKGAQLLYIGSDSAADAQACADELNAQFGGALPVRRTSSLPELARTVVKGAVVRRAKGSTMTWYSVGLKKQMSGLTRIDTPAGDGEPMRIWLGKTGSVLSGFKPTTNLSDLTGSWARNLEHLLTGLGVSRLYLLGKNQEKELLSAQEELRDKGWWDAEREDFAEGDEGDEDMAAAQAIKSWISLEDALQQALGSDAVQATLAGDNPIEVNSCWLMTKFVEKLTDKPRMELTGTKFDRAIHPYVDLLTGAITMLSDKSINAKHASLIKGMALVGEHLVAMDDEPAERTKMRELLLALGQVPAKNYEAEWSQLREKFPLLKVVNSTAVADDGFDALCLAIAAVYK